MVLQKMAIPSSGEFRNMSEQAYSFFAAIVHDGILQSQATSLIERYLARSLSKSLVEKLESVWTDCNIGN
jgi:hypothetical protein